MVAVVRGAFGTLPREMNVGKRPMEEVGWGKCLAGLRQRPRGRASGLAVGFTCLG